MRIIIKTNIHIFLYLRLIYASVLKWKERDVVIRQETKFPEEGTTRLFIDKAGKSPLTISVRYPAWAVWGASVSINGEKVALKQKP